MDAILLPKEFLILFTEEDEQQRVLSLLQRRLEALNTAIVLRNAPTIIHSSNQLRSELMMMGFNDLAQLVTLINDSPFDKSLAQEFQQKLEAWRVNIARGNAV
jgi:hypothetical protein